MAESVWHRVSDMTDYPRARLVKSACSLFV